MRWFSRLPQISASLPVAWIEYSSETCAPSFRCRSNAKAAASNAGPRFADVAGSVMLNLRDCFLEAIAIAGPRSQTAQGSWRQRPRSRQAQAERAAAERENLHPSHVASPQKDLRDGTSK